MTDALFDRFNHALTSSQALPVPKSSFQVMQEKLGAPRLSSLLDDVANGEEGAVRMLHLYGSYARLHCRLGELGIVSTIDQARTILQNHALDDVRSAVTAAMSGNANAKFVLQCWVENTTSPDDAATGVVPSMPPTRRPTGPAERADAGMPPPQPVSNTGRQPYGPPPNRPTGQAERAQPTASRSAQVHHIDEARRPPDPVPEARDVVPRTYDQANAYGGRAALQFNGDITRGNDPTVMIEVATLLNAAERTYNWVDKWRFQLIPHELQLVTALLFDMIPELHFSNHNDKWMTITRQDNDPKYGGTIKFTLGVGKANQNQPRTVQVDSSSLGAITALFVRQCRALLKCDGTTLPAVLRQVAKTYMTQQACRQNRQQQRAG